MKGWHPKKYANKVGMMHESKGQRIGKAPSLHPFHTIQTLYRQHPYMYYNKIRINIKAEIREMESAISQNEALRVAIGKCRICHISSLASHTPHAKGVACETSHIPYLLDQTPLSNCRRTSGRAERNSRRSRILAAANIRVAHA